MTREHRPARCPVCDFRGRRALPCLPCWWRAGQAQAAERAWIDAGFDIPRKPDR